MKKVINIIFKEINEKFKITKIPIVIFFIFFIFLCNSNQALASSTCLITYSANPAKAGPLTITATYTRAVTSIPNISIDQYGSTNTDIFNAPMTQVNGTTFTYSYTVVTDNGIYYPFAYVTLSTVTDIDGDIPYDTTGGILNIDTTPPVINYVSFQSYPSNPTNLSALVVQVDFSETVLGFTADDLVISNGHILSLANYGSGSTFWLYPTSEGLVTINIPAGAITDTAGNISTSAAPQLSITYLRYPDVVLSSSSSSSVNSSFNVTATFSESVTDFTVGDIIVGNGTKGNFSGSGTTYNFTVYPTSNGTVTVNIGAGVAVDTDGNGNGAATQLSRTYDTIQPTVVLSSASSNFVNGPYTATATFSEPVTGLVLGGIIVGNGTASNLSGSGTTYNFLITPTINGLITVNMGAGGTALDAAGNGMVAPLTLNRTYDNVRPPVTLNSYTGSPTNGTIILEAIFNEWSVSNFTADGIIVTNGTVGNFSGSGTAYDFIVTPTANGEVTVRIAEGFATDNAGNTNTASAIGSWIYDTVSPTVVLSSTAPEPTNLLIPVTVTFSEPVLNFEIEDITVFNGTAGNLSGSGTTYNFVITPTANAVVKAYVFVNKVSDIAGNLNIGSSIFGLTYNGMYTFAVSPAITTNGATGTGITCNGGACASAYNYNTAVTVTANPVSGYTAVISGTGSASSCSGSSCNVTITSNTTVTATYTPIVYHTLTITPYGGTGTGTYSGTSAGSIASGSIVTIIATPTVENGSSITVWLSSGAASSCNGIYVDTCSFTMTGDATVRVYYGRSAWPLNITTAHGTVMSSPVAVFCNANPSTCANSIFTGNTLTLTAYADSGYTFTNWSGDCTGDTCIVSSSSNVTANYTANDNIIIFNGNTNTGGSMSPQIIVTDASANIITNSFTKTGYTFAGWNTAPNGSGTSYADGVSYTMGPSNITLYAQWSINSNTLSILANGATMGGTTAGSQTYGSAISITQTPATGYTFTGWTSTGSVCTGTGTCSFNMPGNDVIVTANYTLIVSTVSTSGSIVNFLPTANFYPTSRLVNYGSNTTFDIYPVTGYHIVSVSGCDGSFVAPTYTTGAITTDCTVTATTAINTYTVTFDKNGGDTEASPTTRNADYYNTTVTLPTEPTRTGYTFNSWNTLANGTGTTFTSATEVTSSYTVYAKWDIMYFTVSTIFGLDINLTPTSISVSYGSTTTFDIVVDPGHFIVGISGCNGSFVDPNDRTYTTGPITAPCTVSTNTAVGYNALYITANGGTMGGTTAGVKNYGTAISITQTPTTGYTFTGWTSTGSVCTGTGTCAFSMPDNAVDVVANYTAATQYTLTIPASTGTGSGSYGGTSAGSVIHGTSVSITATPAASSNFTSWTATGAAASCNGTTTSPCAFTMAGVASVTATYTLNSNALSITANGGTMGGTIAGSKTYGSAISITQTPPTGYTFTGWSSTGSVCTGTGTCAFNMPDNAVDVVANYTPNNNTITFDGNTATGGYTPSQIIATGATANLTANGFTKTDYYYGVFLGWNTQANGTGTNYANGASYTMGPSNVILYAQWGTSSNSDFENDIVFIDSTHFVKIYVNSVRLGVAVVGTISNGSISYGEEYFFNINQVQSIHIAKLTSNSVIIYYADISLGLFYAKIATITNGNQITFGSSYPTGAYGGAISVLSPTTFVVGGRFDNWYFRSMIGTVSGNTISFGPITDTRIVYSTNYSFTTLSSTSFILTYTGVYDYDYNVTRFASMIGTVSGTNISYSQEYRIYGNYESYYNYNGYVYDSSVVALSPTSFVVIFSTDDHDSLYPDWPFDYYDSAIVGTVSDNSISFGGRVNFNSTSSDSYTTSPPNTFYSAISLSPTDFWVVRTDYYNPSDPIYSTFSNIGRVSDNSILYYQPQSTVSVLPLGFISAANYPGSDYFAIAYLPSGYSLNPSGNVMLIDGSLFDITDPTVTLSSSTSEPTNGPINVTATFSEPVTGFTVEDISVTNGTAGTFAGSGDTYTFVVTPTANGLVIISIPYNSAIDSVNNRNVASAPLTRNYDTQRPVVTLSSSTPEPTNGPLNVTATFSEPVTGFTVEDISVTNGTAGTFAGSGTTYTFVVTPTANGLVSVNIPADVAIDTSNNGNDTISPVIGSDYGGGKLAYILQSGDPGYIADGVTRGLIAAVSDQGLGYFGGYGSYISGTSTALGSGNTNTSIIIALIGSSSSYAAGLANNYDGGGYNDWYLPSSNELYRLYLNKVAIGNFNVLYWSSSDYYGPDPYDQYYAHVVRFDNGADVAGPKQNQYSVRAIRSFANVTGPLTRTYTASAVLPTIITQPINKTTSTTSSTYGEIINYGNELNDIRGVVYDTVSHSSPGNIAPSSSLYPNKVEETGSFGIGTFSLNMSGLTANTKYYIRAYSHNTTGYSYGDEISFTTTTSRSRGGGSHTESNATPSTTQTGGTNGGGSNTETSTTPASPNTGGGNQGGGGGVE